MQITTSVLVTKRRFVFGTVKTGLLALDRDSLEVAWKGRVGESMAAFAPYSKPPQHCVGTAPFLMPDGSVCASSADGAIHFWEEASGRHQSEIRTGAPYFAAPTLARGRLYAADASGRLRVFAV